MTNSWYDEATTHQHTRRFAMAQNEYTTNRKYRHLTREKRAQIEVAAAIKAPPKVASRAKSGLQGQLYIMNLPEVLYSS